MLRQKHNKLKINILNLVTALRVGQIPLAGSTETLRRKLLRVLATCSNCPSDGLVGSCTSVVQKEARAKPAAVDVTEARRPHREISATTELHAPDNRRQAESQKPRNHGHAQKGRLPRGRYVKPEDRNRSHVQYLLRRAGVLRLEDLPRVDSPVLIIKKGFKNVLKDTWDAILAGVAACGITQVELNSSDGPQSVIKFCKLANTLLNMANY